MYPLFNLLTKPVVIEEAFIETGTAPLLESTATVNIALNVKCLKFNVD